MIKFSHPAILSPLMTGEELAVFMGYDGVTSSFRNWCKSMGIQRVPGRVNIYDPKHVRERLDIAQNILSPMNTELPAVEMPLTEKRRARRGA